MAEHNVLEGFYHKPWQENSGFIVAMANCNRAKYDFVPARIQNKTKIDEALKALKEKK